MKINRSRIDTEKLRGIPENERALFVLLGHVVNEINILNKTFYLSMQFPKEPKWRIDAHSAQSLVFARALAGKLYEVWQFLREGYFGTQLSREYNGRLDAEAREALDNLKRYFGRDNLIETIRNRFAFHYSLDDTKAALQRELPEEEMVMYLADNANTLFHFSEVVVNAALIEALDPAHHQAMDRLLRESQLLVKWFNVVAGEIMSVVIERYLLQDDGTLAREEVDIGTPPVAENVEIPFFFTIDRAKDKSE